MGYALALAGTAYDAAVDGVYHLRDTIVHDGQLVSAVVGNCLEMVVDGAKEAVRDCRRSAAMAGAAVGSTVDRARDEDPFTDHERPQGIASNGCAVVAVAAVAVPVILKFTVG